jgi:predicted component of type VI protein secretion system
MSATLITFGRKGARKEFPLSVAKTIIGRREDADIRIPLAEVSRAHCELVVRGEKVVLKDLDSSNGTFVNDRQVTDTTLKAGDRLRIGPVVFILQIDGQPADIRPPQAPAPPKPTAPAAAATEVARPSAKAGSESDLDIDQLEEIDAEEVEDVSDLDLDLDGIGGSSPLDDIDAQIKDLRGEEPNKDEEK